MRTRIRVTPKAGWIFIQLFRLLFLADVRALLDTNICILLLYAYI